MVARDLKDIHERLRELPLRRYIEVLRNRVAHLNRKLNIPAYFDQYPGKCVPWMFSKLYGPISLQTAVRNASNNGHEKTAALVTPSTFVSPSGGNIFVGRDATFYWCSSNVTGYLHWSYSSSPGFTSPITSKSHVSIWDRVFEDNGGAVVLNSFAATAHLDRPRLAFDVVLYDKKRGRVLHDGRLPAEMFAGLSYGFKRLPEPMKFDPDTEIEPRVYVNEFRMGNMLDTDATYDVANVKGYLCLMFKGFLSLE